MEVSILDAQHLLGKLGVAHGPDDGLYGPKTRGGWMTAAAPTGLPPDFERVGPTIARVWSATWRQLNERANAAVSGGVSYIP